MLDLPDRNSCHYDLMSLGECMIRLSPPGHGRIEFATELEVWVGGGEYNAAYALARLGMRAGFLSRLVDNPLGRIIINHGRAGGVDMSHVVMAPFDNLGRADRVGLNFTEVGTGVRPSVTMYDRGHSAASHLRPGMIDFSGIFGGRGVRWFHTGGIFPALSEGCAAVCREALLSAKAAGAVTSYDLNFRSSLWTIEAARRVTQELAPHVDVLVGNDGIIRCLLGDDGGAAGEEAPFDATSFTGVAGQVVKKFPNLRAIATTVRAIRSGLVNDWQGFLYTGGALHASRRYDNLEMEDRIGAGDGFCAGIAYGSLNGMPPQECLELAAAYGALLHTTRGDTSQVTLDEVLHVARGGGAQIRR